MILEEIAASTRRRVDRARAAAPFEAVRDAALATGTVRVSGAAFPFEDALSPNGAHRREYPGPAFICEVKKASPSKGLIAAEFPYLDIARAYEAAGAAAVSVLTEPEYFLGSDDYLREIAGAVQIPALRKDFVVDSYQIYEAALLGAKAVLLICALFDDGAFGAARGQAASNGVPGSGGTLAEYIRIADSLGLSALVEAHSEDEVKAAVDAGARIIGINNRDLKTFTVDINTTGRLRKFIPGGIITVSESGIKSAEDIRVLTEYGIDAFLIGETLMRATDKKQYLCALRGAVL
ncbi:indole-3-glycerol phosphate synthase [Spirochaetia bacterium]|nr:indole-3-glycerol phosphate synthase [Spirochaetia bacterium]GHT74601.1 indole-3-glycerol phosphate synthase [Spirochaetia bacterium]